MLTGVQTHEVVWSKLLPELEHYGCASPEARDTLLSLKGTTSIERGRFGAEIDDLIDTGLLTPLQDPRRVKLAPAGNRAAVAVRAAMRWPVLFDGSRDILRRYVQENFSPDLREALLWDEPYSYGDLAGTIADRARDPAWIDRALAEEAPAAQRRGRTRRCALLRLEPALRSRLALVVKKLSSLDGPVPIAELRAMVGDASAAEFDALVQTAIRELVLFPGVDRDTGRMVMGLAAEIHALLTREPIGEPTILDVALQDVPAYAALDLNIALVAVAGGTVRVRANDGSLYKRDADALAAELTSIGSLGNPLLEMTNTERLGDAIALGHTLDLMEVTSGPDGRSRLVATAAGRDWLATDHPTRLTRLLGLVRPAPDETREYGPAWDSLLNGLGYTVAFGLDVPATVRTCSEELARLPRDGGIRMREFVVHAACERNPFRNQIPGRDTARIWHGHSGRSLQQGESERLWAQILLGAIGKLLWPWGGLRIASVPTPGGEGTEIAVGLTAVGAYLLGLENAPPVQPAKRRSSARVIVQPTFEITFLDPDPQAESELALFCQRLGGGLGVLFRITRDSVSRAASAGTPIEFLMETLQRISAKPIPANVGVEVRSWHARQRILILDRPWILRCGDAETAERVLSEAPRLLERIGEDILALRDGTRPETVAKALAAHGITIDVTKAPTVAAKSATRRPRRRRYR